MVYVVIMAGGKGERFWPKSTRSKPKQFHRIATDRTMVRETFFRVYPEYEKERILFVLGKHLSTPLLQELPEIGEGNLILEPVGRNTAPAIGLAAARIEMMDSGAVMAVLSADHLITPKGEFLKALDAAVQVAETGRLLTFGITPVRPATEYGYIEVKKPPQTAGGLPVYDVVRFTEKPDERTARGFIESGRYFWNSGMFVFKVSEILSAIERYMPRLYASLVRIQKASGTKEEENVTRDEFGRIESESIDYGIMEKSGSIACIAPEFVWDDVGSWGSLDRYREHDDMGNVTEGDVVLVDSQRNIVLGEEGSIITLVGAEDLIVVKERNRILVCRKDCDQRVKEVLKRLSEDENGMKYL
ncbi:MAG: mannose-1-phosphate guanylyltransferase [Spirochaetes bacterium]|nr:mannose-1-phosphate guanylyltransferase [Spirochaetota bacterium]